jgi:hypothetical protein
LPFTVDVVDMKTVKDPLKAHIYTHGVAWGANVKTSFPASPEIASRGQRPGNSP